MVYWSRSVLISNEIFHLDDFLFKSEFDRKVKEIQDEVDEISQFVTQYNELMLDLSPYLIDEGIRTRPVWLSNESSAWMISSSSLILRAKRRRFMMKSRKWERFLTNFKKLRRITPHI